MSAAQTPVEEFLPSTLLPEFIEPITTYQHATKRVQLLVSSMSPTQFQWRPRAGEWSIAEVLDHLNNLHGQLLPRMQQGIAHAREQGWQPTPNKHPKPGTAGSLFIWGVKPHSWMKIKTPPTYAPQPNLPREEVLPKFVQTQEAMIACIQSTHTVDTGRIRIASPVSNLLTFNLYAWILALSEHLKLHMQQIDGILAAPGYPAGDA